MSGASEAFSAATMKALLRPLASLKAEDAPWAGGKAMGLAKALGAGVPVPAGLVLGPAALDAVLDHAGLSKGYAAAIEEARQERFEAMETLMRELVGTNFPSALSEALVEAISALPIGPLAVRSSASAEDRVEGAGAGAFGSELGVGRPDVDAAIRRVWARAHAPSAFQAMLAGGLDPASLKLAVIVQAEVPADWAGVLFTVDPLDPSHQRMRAALRPAHASGVVEGEAAEEATFPRAGALERRAGPPTAQQQAWRALRPLGLKLEAAFGRPLDVEAAWLGGRWTVLQVRPIASLGPEALKGPALRWSRALAEERFPEPLSPFGWSALQSALKVNLDSLESELGFTPRPPEVMVRSVGGVVYANPDFFKVPESLKPSKARLFRELKPLWATLLLQGPGAWWRHKRGATPGLPLGRTADDPRFRLAVASFQQLVFPRARAIEAAWEQEFAGHQEAYARLGAIDPKPMGRGELIDHARALQAASDAFMKPDFPIYALKEALAWMVRQVAAVVAGGPDPEALVRLTGGLSANATLEMNAALDQMARSVMNDPFLHDALRLGDRAAIAQAWGISAVAQQREAFLSVYGHLSPSWDIAKPTLAERPERLDAWVYARMAAPKDAGAKQHASLAAKRESELEAWKGRLAFDPKLVAFAEELVGHLHAMIRLDEAHHMHAGRLIPAERRLLAAIGRRLAEAGAIEAPMDVCFLTLDELLEALLEPLPFSRRRLVARRQQAYDAACARKEHPPELWGDFPVEAKADEASDPDVLSGQGASPGVVEGPVRVVHDLADLAKLQPGEVLVAASPKPSFTPGFAYASALVTDRGSSLSHGLITAREYGLPAVTATLDATRRLHTGDRVRVDGASGRVVRLRQASEGPEPAGQGAAPTGELRPGTGPVAPPPRPPAPKAPARSSYPPARPSSAPRPTPWTPSAVPPGQAFPSLGPVRKVEKAAPEGPAAETAPAPDAPSPPEGSPSAEPAAALEATPVLAGPEALGAPEARPLPEAAQLDAAAAPSEAGLEAEAAPEAGLAPESVAASEAGAASETQSAPEAKAATPSELSSDASGLGEASPKQQAGPKRGRRNKRGGA